MLEILVWKVGLGVQEYQKEVLEGCRYAIYAAGQQGTTGIYRQSLDQAENTGNCDTFEPVTTTFVFAAVNFR